MGKAQRRKGLDAEREFAKRIGGMRVPLSGAQDGYANDVRGLGLEWEVKRKKSGYKAIYDVLNDTRECPDAMAFRVDREDWVISMKLERFLQFLKEHEKRMMG